MLDGVCGICGVGLPDHEDNHGSWEAPRCKVHALPPAIPARPRLNDDELAARLRDPSCPAPGTLWRHHRTNTLYRVERCVIDEATAAVCVVYARWDQAAIPFCRPLAEWLEPLDHPTMPGLKVRRYLRQVD